ncbi:hypothetical protein W97_00989 [Coniosporium apollinis CBS 100218]|uniref:Uncharacterized protein n=1 Tax=Coniosporium apollinis (strain CBS 100218) TaxID=1168221 RepID=R7YIR0_CONA1|nr:uncharacterized protein W97_00989 [Coniosporium apollinis CBS 100218]EON61773.1 hypothetical protein W97_00989 [Coniosporium apollinis CBS 100218]
MAAENPTVQVVHHLAVTAIARLALLHDEAHLQQTPTYPIQAVLLVLANALPTDTVAGQGAPVVDLGVETASEAVVDQARRLLAPCLHVATSIALGNLTPGRLRATSTATSHAMKLALAENGRLYL